MDFAGSTFFSQHTSSPPASTPHYMPSPPVAWPPPQITDTCEAAATCIASFPTCGSGSPASDSGPPFAPPYKGPGTAGMLILLRPSLKIRLKHYMNLPNFTSNKNVLQMLHQLKKKIRPGALSTPDRLFVCIDSKIQIFP